MLRVPPVCISRSKRQRWLRGEGSICRRETGGPGGGCGADRVTKHGWVEQETCTRVLARGRVIEDRPGSCPGGRSGGWPCAPPRCARCPSFSSCSLTCALALPRGSSQSRAEESTRRPCPRTPSAPSRRDSSACSGWSRNPARAGPPWCRATCWTCSRRTRPTRNQNTAQRSARSGESRTSLPAELTPSGASTMTVRGLLRLTGVQKQRVSPFLRREVGDVGSTGVLVIRRLCLRCFWRCVCGERAEKSVCFWKWATGVATSPSTAGEVSGIANSCIQPQEMFYHSSENPVNIYLASRF